MQRKRLLLSVGIALVTFMAVLIVMQWRSQVAGLAPSPPDTDGPPISWRQATPNETSAAMLSIRNQLDAFRRNDYASAAAFQSQSLRANFQDPSDFRRMMQSQYPEFAHYRSARFGEVHADGSGDRVEADVAVTGQDGVTQHAVYLMVREGGIYRVAGVGGGAEPPSKRPLFRTGPDSGGV